MEAQIEEAIKFRKKANFKILTRLSQIIDQYPYLRFHQILMIYKISELGVDKFNEESAFNAMIADNLFVVNVDKDLLWMSYLLSFEDETIRQDHNCNACKSFIRHYGKVVAIDPSNLQGENLLG